MDIYKWEALNVWLRRQKDRVMQMIKDLEQKHPLFIDMGSEQLATTQFEKVEPRLFEN